MRRHKILVFFLGFFIFGLDSFGQTIVSPYSSSGIGELNSMALPNHEAMGGLGLGYISPRHINIQNPAFLVYNVYSTFQVGFKADFRDFNADNSTASDATASMRYLIMSFPIINSKWTSSAGLLPYSSVNYDLFKQTPVTDDVNAANRIQGEGGLSQVFWANGIRLYNDITLGIRAGYVFGSLRKITRSNLTSDIFIVSDYAIELTEDVNYSEFLFYGSLGNRFKLSGNSFLNVGLIYGIPGTSKGKNTITFQRLSVLNGVVLQEEVVEEGITVDNRLPSEIGLGLSYARNDKLSVGLDASMIRWRTTSEENVELNDAIKFVLGGEYIPDPTSVRNYFSRVNYRAGLSYQQLPYLINNTEINEFGINFGASFPVNQVSSFDAAFRFGWRGTTDNGLVRENYFQVILGATINDVWFIKRRYD